MRTGRAQLSAKQFDIGAPTFNNASIAPEPITVMMDEICDS